MSVSRLDSLWPSDFGDPHFVKIDTQGYDLEVLVGFGDLLKGVLCAEIEVRISEQYVNQCLASDIYKFMNQEGFDLVGLLSNGLQSGAGMMVFNAFFIKRSAADTSAVKLWRIVNNIGSLERVKALGF